MSVLAPEASLQLGSEVAISVVDCDVHPQAVSIKEFVPYIPEPWRSRYYARYPHEVEISSILYVSPVHEGLALGQRADAIPKSGTPTGSDPELMERQLFREAGVDVAMLIPMQPRPKIEYPAFESAVMAGSNAWLPDVWLDKNNAHRRYRGALRVSPNDPLGAAREIEQWAGHPYINQIYVPPESSVPYGHPQFHPIWEAAARHGLPVSMHLIIQPGPRWLSPVGFNSYHLESFSLWIMRYIGQLASLIFEGVFEKFPDLRVVVLEAGIAWLPACMWRLDNYWETLRSELPHVPKRPSDYLREHVRVSTQPLEEPAHEDLLRIMDWADAERMLLFATDYPHYDFDNPGWVSAQLREGARDRIMFENAIELFNLPRTRPVDRLDLERAADAADARARRRDAR